MSGQPQPAPGRAADACPSCGAELLQTTGGELCAACVFAAGLAAESGMRVGPYDLLQELDAGGTGIVYIARHADQEGLVAIKLARPELLASADALAAFRNGVRIQQALRDLSNIVPVYDLGTDHDGRPYSVMPLLDGGTLADRQPRARNAAPTDALELMISIARAVERAHHHGVLHCDLKPGNVLFDAKGTPFVSDFGLARVLDTSELTRGAAFQGGTPGFMSPEQAQQQTLTTASDIFSLGVMLYWLVTGSLPFGGGDDYLRRVVQEREPPLRELYSGSLCFELESICARAMHKDPEQRYRSAAELADDLVRARDGLPIQAERHKFVRRAVKWTRRHKLAALAGVELGLLLLYLPLMPISVLREVKNTIREQISFSALAQAGAVMNELRASAARVEQLADDPEVQRLVTHTDPHVPPPRLLALNREFDGLSVFSAEGVLRARAPLPRARSPRPDFAFRDYFQGQLRIAHAGLHEVYVARAFHSTGDEEPMLGLATPLYQEGKYNGALVARTRARATFGAVQMNCGQHESCMTALLGARDRDDEHDKMPDWIYVLAAPGLADGQELMLDSVLARRICSKLPCQPAASNQFAQAAHPRPIVVDDYRDPISHIHSMAALAPVGGTGLIVVVATPNNTLDAITRRMTDRVKTFIWVPVLLGLLLLGAVLAFSR